MSKKVSIAIFAFCFLMVSITQAGSFTPTNPSVLDLAYAVRTIVTPSNLGHGTNGLNFDPKDNLYVGSVSGVATYRVDTGSGEAAIFVGAPDGGADDMIFTADGKMYWNAFFLGKTLVRLADGKMAVLAENLPGANAIAMNGEGRLFISQCFLGDAIWEIDLSGKQKNRKVAGNLGGPNGCMFGPDGYLYMPLWFKGQIVKMDVNTGNYKVVAEGFKVPSAVKFDSKGNLFTTDTATGEVFRVDVNTGGKTPVAKLEPHLDNLAFDSKDHLYVTNMAVNGVYEVDIRTGKVRTVTEAKLCYPQGIAVANDPDGDVLYVADNFNYKRVDAFTGNITTPDNKSSFPNTCVISADGNYVLMSGWFTNKIQVFDRKTDQLLYTIPGFQLLAGTLMLADGSVLAAEGSGNIVRVTDKEGKEKTVVTTGLAAPTYMAEAGPGEIYVTEYTAGRVTRVDLATGNKQVICQGLAGPKGIAVKPEGKLVVVEAEAKRLIELDPTSGAIKPIVANLAIGQPGSIKGGHPAFSFTGVAVAKSGAIYVTSDLENTIYMVYPR